MSDALRSLRGPTDLMALAGVAVPSPALAVVLKGAYGLPPDPGEAGVWRGVSRMPWPRAKVRRVAACLGRRSMKTSVLIAWSAVYELLCGGHEEYAAAGSRVYSVVIAPKLSQAREAVRGVRAVLDQLAPLGVRYEARDASGSPEIVITAPASRCVPVISVQVADSVGVRGFAVPFVAFDEAGFLPSEEWLAERDTDIIRAVAPAQLQFPRALMMFASSPGRPGSAFHKLVEQPPAGTLVARGATWTFNPRITREQCLAEAGGDEAVFATEYEASRWGWAGTAFIDSAAIYRCLGSEHAEGVEAGPEQSITALDVGQLGDNAAISKEASFEVEVPSHAPIRHAVVLHAEEIEADKKNPPSIEQIVARTVAIAGGSPVVFDAFAGPTVKENFRKLGYREFVDPSGTRTPPPYAYWQLSMAAHHQTPRWKLLRDLVHGSRFHMRADHEALAKELVGLSATTLSSGALRVEGRKDNIADTVALACPIAVRLPPVAGRGIGAPEFDVGSFSWEPGEKVLSNNGAGWVRRMPSGAMVPCECPTWDPMFPQWAQSMLDSGHSTPSIEKWRREREERGDDAPLNVEIDHGSAPRAPNPDRFNSFGGWGGGWDSSTRKKER